MTLKGNVFHPLFTFAGYGFGDLHPRGLIIHIISLWLNKLAS